jgi:2-phosphoglycerate kinase
MDKKPVIIILNGTYGVGKSTIAHQLGIDLQIKTVINLSGITRTIKTLLPNDPMARDWSDYDSTDKERVRDKLIRMAKTVGDVIGSQIVSLEAEVSNCIIEGVQLLPRFIDINRVLFFHVHVSSGNRHEMQFTQPTITKITQKMDTTYELAKAIGEIIHEECKEYPINYIDNIGTPEESSWRIIEKIKADYPDYANRYLWCEQGRV